MSLEWFNATDIEISVHHAGDFMPKQDEPVTAHLALCFGGEGAIVQGTRAELDAFLALAKVKLEAAPDLGVWTFFGHWADDGRIIVTTVMEGTSDDPRVDTGEHALGLWCATGSGETLPETQAATIAEYEGDR